MPPKGQKRLTKYASRSDSGESHDYPTSPRADFGQSHDYPTSPRADRSDIGQSHDYPTSPRADIGQSHDYPTSHAYPTSRKQKLRQQEDNPDYDDNIQYDAKKFSDTSNKVMRFEFCAVCGIETWDVKPLDPYIEAIRNSDVQRLYDVKVALWGEESTASGQQKAFFRDLKYHLENGILRGVNFICKDCAMFFSSKKKLAQGKLQCDIIK